MSRLCSSPVSFKLFFRCGRVRSYLVTCILLHLTVKPFPTIPLRLPSATLTSAVLTQKMDPQYFSRAAAHMVHADGFTFPYTAPLALCLTAAEADWNASTFSPDHHTRETIAGRDSEGLWAMRLWSRSPSLWPPCAEKKTKICQRNTESVSEVTDFKCFRQKIIQVFHKRSSVLVEPCKKITHAVLWMSEWENTATADEVIDKVQPRTSPLTLTCLKFNVSLRSCCLKRERVREKKKKQDDLHKYPSAVLPSACGTAHQKESVFMGEGREWAYTTPFLSSCALCSLHVWA